LSAKFAQRGGIQMNQPQRNAKSAREDFPLEKPPRRPARCALGEDTKCSPAKTHVPCARPDLFPISVGRIHAPIAPLAGQQNQLMNHPSALFAFPVSFLSRQVHFNVPDVQTDGWLLRTWHQIAPITALRVMFRTLQSATLERASVALLADTRTILCSGVKSAQMVGMKIFRAKKVAHFALPGKVHKVNVPALFVSLA
jgi:hypothetical protein